AAFLCLIAVVPSAVSSYMGIPPLVAQFLGGTGLLIVVSVALDMVQRIEANLLMRNYGGFLSGGQESKGKRIKGRQYGGRGKGRGASEHSLRLPLAPRRSPLV